MSLIVIASLFQLQGFALDVMLTNEHRFVSKVSRQIRQMPFRHPMLVNVTEKTAHYHPKSKDGSLMTFGSCQLCPKVSMDETHIYKPLKNNPVSALIFGKNHGEAFVQRFLLTRKGTNNYDGSYEPANFEARHGPHRLPDYYYSAWSHSIVVDAPIVVVSEKLETISLFHLGMMQSNIQLETFEGRLRLVSESLVRTQVQFRERFQRCCESP